MKKQAQAQSLSFLARFYQTSRARLEARRASSSPPSPEQEAQFAGDHERLWDRLTEDERKALEKASS